MRHRWPSSLCPIPQRPEAVGRPHRRLRLDSQVFHMFHYGAGVWQRGTHSRRRSGTHAESRPGGRMVAATDLPKHTAEKAIEAVLAAISASLPQGEAVTLRGLGTFAVRTKRARQAATPRPERPRPFCPGGSSCLRPARSSSRPWRAPRRAARQERLRDPCMTLGGSPCQKRSHHASLLLNSSRP